MIKLAEVLGEVGLRNMDAELTFADAESLAQQLGTLLISSRWAIGDLVILIEELFGEESAQLLNAFGLAEKTLSNIASICRKVPPKARRADLSWSHHEAVAVLDDPNDMIDWLARAVASHWTRDELRTAMITAGVIKAAGRVTREPAPSAYSWDPELQAKVASVIQMELQAWLERSEMQTALGCVMPATLHRELEELAQRLATAVERAVCPPIAP